MTGNKKWGLWLQNGLYSRITTLRGSLQDKETPSSCELWKLKLIVIELSAVWCDRHIKITVFRENGALSGWELLCAFWGNTEWNLIDAMKSSWKIQTKWLAVARKTNKIQTITTLNIVNKPVVLPVSKSHTVFILAAPCGCHTVTLCKGKGKKS